MAATEEEENVISQCYHGELREEFVEDMLKENGDFLIRKSQSQDLCVSVLWNGTVLHCSPKMSGIQFTFGAEPFDRLEDLVCDHWKNAKPLTDFRERPLLKKPIRHRTTVYRREQIVDAKEIGQGSFAKVFRVRLLSDNKKYAMKTLSGEATREAKENFKSEMSMMAAMRHRNVLKCYGTVEDDKDINILMELVNGGSLDKLLRKKKITTIGKSRITIQVANGMTYLHSHRIIHRDLASRNILIQRNEDGSLVAKVSDFGLSRRDEHGQGYELKKAQKLPIKWMAPECFRRQSWTMASDVWSYGILVWEIYTDGKEPYSDMDFGQDDVDNFVRFVSGGGHPRPLKNARKEVNDLMTFCWTADPDRRPKMADVVKRLAAIFPAVCKSENETSDSASEQKKQTTTKKKK